MRKSKNFFRILMSGLLVMSVCLFVACDNGDVNEYSLPEITVGETFEITVPATSGPYLWHYEINSNSGIEYIDRKFIPQNDDPDYVGGGSFIYTFKAIKSGDYKIKLSLKAMYEDKSPAKTNLYKIKVIKSK